jgi:uncharacterized protein YjeT (DUF2065 family)
MSELFVALGLVLVIEGIVYAAFPQTMKRAIAEVLKLADEHLRWAALGAAVVGLGIVWLAQGG